MSYTYTKLEIEAAAFDHILTRIHAAGEEYVKRYYDERDGERIIHFEGSEVALVTPKEPAKDSRCICRGFYRPPNCPVHGN